MTDDYEKHVWRAKLTFRQAEGLDPIPQVLRWGELDRDFRLKIHDFFLDLFNRHLINHTTWLYSFVENYYRGIGQFTRIEARKKIYTTEYSGEILSLIETGEWADVLEFVTYSIRSHDLAIVYKRTLEDVLSDQRCPYLIYHFDGVPTIIPKNTKAEEEALLVNLSTILMSTFEGAKEHLKKASEALSVTPQPKYADVVREAVHAVESAACVIVGNPKATLSDALKQIKGDLHPALYEGLQKLYGYAGDERGIRHSLVEGENERVSAEEAILAFSICAAIVGYLVRKFPEKS